MAHTINANLEKQNAVITLNTAGTFVQENIEITASLKNGTFNNRPTEGIVYAEETSEATILPSEGSLYLSAGWYENTKITLDHMLPDDTDADNAGTNNIMAGFEAYDEKGKKLIGTLATVHPTFSGGVVTVTASGSVTATPSVTIINDIIGNISTYAGTTTKPSSGTAGTNFIAIGISTTPNNGSVSAKADGGATALIYASNATGYINKTGATAKVAQTATQNTKSITVTPTINDTNYGTVYIPITRVETTAGTITPTAVSVATSPKFNVSLTKSSTSSNYGVTETQPTGTEGTNFLKFTPDGAGVATQTNVTMTLNQTATTVKTKPGVIAKTDSTIIAANTGLTKTSSTSVTPIKNTVAKPVYIPITGVQAVVAAPTISNPSVTGSLNISIDGVAVSGVLSTKPTSTDAQYITIQPVVTTVSGSAKSNASAKTTGAGVVTANTTSTSVQSSASSITVTNNTSQSAMRWIKVFNPSDYTIS